MLRTGAERLVGASTRSVVMGMKGMVACSNPLAAEAGLAILKSGGSAVEAAVTVGSVLAVVEPCSTGLGGDGFCLLYNKEAKGVKAVNGSGRAPAALTLEQALKDVPAGDALPALHAHTVTVPGVVAMWCDLLDTHASGAVTREDIFRRAIELAADGFPVTPVTASLWKNAQENLKATAHGRELLTAAETAPSVGEVFKRPGLAAVLREIASKGKNGFYQGWVADSIVATLQEVGGVMTHEDLAGHTTTYPAAVKTSYGGVDVWGHPPNGQGITALIALNTLEAMEKEGKVSFSKEKWGSPEVIHAQIEALRLAFADARKFIADPDFEDIPLEGLLSKEYGAERAKLFDATKAAASVEAGQPLKDSCTVSFQTVDKDGNAVSMVNSTYVGFGSNIVPKGTGFTLQNRGYNFSLVPTDKNCIAPKKRPYHTIIPCITTNEDGSLHTTFTNMGGFMQPQGHVQHLINMLKCGFDPQESIDHPRFCILNDAYSGIFGKVALEPGFDPTLLEALKAMGHDAYIAEGMQRSNMGRAQIILRLESGVLVAGSDHRCDGCAIGY